MQKTFLLAWTACFFIAFLIGLPIAGGLMSFEIKSSAFNNGSAIPPKYTCDGSDTSPPLEWKDPPANTKSFALIADDPDAPMGTWVHWVMWNIPPSSNLLKEGLNKIPVLPDGAKQGQSDFKRPGYGGPCPPSGTHRYFFKLYALDTVLDLPPETTKAKLESAMKGHIIAQAATMGTYTRAK